MILSWKKKIPRNFGEKFSMYTSIYSHLFRLSSFIFFSGLLGLLGLLCLGTADELCDDADAEAVALGVAVGGTAVKDGAATTGAACGG